MDFPTQNDLVRIFKDELLAQNGRLTSDVADRDGTDVNILANGTGAMADEVVGQLVDVESGLFLDSATGKKLDRFVFDRFGLTRKPAAPALGSVQFSTTAANPSPFTIASGTVLSTSDGVQFATTAAALFPASTTGPIIVPVRSVLAGLDQQAASGTITSIVSTISGQPADLVVTNSLATSGAADAESDTDLRNRARRFWVTARRGTLSAVEQGALTVPGVQSAKAIEVYDTSGRPARLVQLVVADQFTDALVKLNVNPPAYETQSQQLAVQVFQSLDDFRPAGTFVQVIVAQVVLLPVTLELKFNAGADVDLTALIARAVVSAYAATLQPGATFSRDAVLALLRQIPGLYFTGEEVASPDGDVIPRALQVIRVPMRMATACALQGDNPVVLAGTTNPDAFIIRGLLGPGA